ncbi:T9SS type A sorting domain-containing protein [Flavobacterium sp. SUN046]|uniref:T9SS type A sorting domain-containing protein n=1 Tax=Flavobacterium sp. SUN046 TaxID=3002440 RepID=UPI002DBF3EEF|nr:T9SS type A sorting domain-containing protein [Flavobacterium sp. SUN046]MEC4048835.1 T9SS type A sorting domain-containing protein [Flavobacterium sp. SUN046]
MKKTISKLFFALMLFINIINAQSQDKWTLLKDCLWIKGIEVNSKTIDSIKLKGENLFKKQLNFNPIIDFSKERILKTQKNIITKKATLFVVFRNTDKAENSLLTIQGRAFKAIVSNKKIISEEEVLLNKGDSKKGSILSYLYNNNSIIGKKKGNLVLEDILFNDKEDLNQLAELIYIPRCVSVKEKEIIESYLSIKYGISLNEGQNYYNSKRDTLWNCKENKVYNKRITGIGKDEFLELNQKQSKNSLDDGLTLGLTKIKKTNTENQEILNDKEFVLWADNDKTTLLEKSDDVTQKRIKRIWKVKTFSENNTNYLTQIRIDKALMPLEVNFNSQDPDIMWLAIDNTNSSEFDYKNAKFIKATINNEKEIIFDGIEFLSNSEYLFTIIKAKENPNFSSNSSKTTNNIATSDNNATSRFGVYPNPVSANEKFTIQFNLKDSSKVSVQITDVNGKVIRDKNLGIIDTYSFVDSLSVAGTYLIIININDNLETSKLIVK